MIEKVNQQTQAMLSFQTLTLPTLKKILNYLSLSDLQCLNNSITDIAQFEQFSQVIQLRITFLQYYGKCDRSYYCSLYQLTMWRNIEIQVFQENVMRNMENQGSFNYFVGVQGKMKEMVRGFVGFVDEQFREQLSQHIQGMFLDPAIPMPKLLRQTLPSASSPFQNFILSIISDSNLYLQPSQPIFVQILQKFTQNQQVTLRNMIQNAQKCSKLIYNLHDINNQKLNENYINGNSLHNLLVSLFAITSNYLDSVRKYLGLIEDQGHLIVELTTRYQMFVGTVISVQENFGELFKNYGQLYDQLFNQGNQTCFNYWKPAMKMWQQKMSQFYQTTTPYFIHLCQQHMKNSLTNTLDQQKYAQIYSRFALTSNLQSSFNYNNSSYIEQLLNQYCQGQIQVLISNYLESLVDLGIDERSLLMNGHSEQEIGGLYQKMEEKIIENQHNWIKSLKEHKFDDYQLSLVAELIDEKLIKFSEVSKPRTIKSLQTIYQINHFKIIPKQSQIQTDNEIEHCLQIIKRFPSVKKYFQVNTQTVSTYGLKSKFTLKSMLHETADSDREVLDQSFQFYDSDQEEDSDKLKIDVKGKIIKEDNIQVKQKLYWEKQMVKQLSKSS